jgi:hypothetical protein
VATDLLYQGFRFGIGTGMGLLVCYLLALSARELGYVVRLAGEWIGARRTEKRVSRWVGEKTHVKKGKVG